LKKQADNNLQGKIQLWFHGSSVIHDNSATCHRIRKTDAPVPKSATTCDVAIRIILKNEAVFCDSVHKHPGTCYDLPVINKRGIKTLDKFWKNVILGIVRRIDHTQQGVPNA